MYLINEFINKLCNKSLPQGAFIYKASVHNSNKVFIISRLIGIERRCQIAISERGFMTE